MKHFEQTPHTDRMLLPEEMILMSAQTEEQKLEQTLLILADLEKLISTEYTKQEVANLHVQLRRAQVNTKLQEHFLKFGDSASRLAEAERIKKEGLPPEVFENDGNFVVEGPATVQ